MPVSLGKSLAPTLLAYAKKSRSRRFLPRSICALQFPRLISHSDVHCGNCSLRCPPGHRTSICNLCKSHERKLRAQFCFTGDFSQETPCDAALSSTICYLDYRSFTFTRAALISWISNGAIILSSADAIDRNMNLFCTGRGRFRRAR